MKVKITRSLDISEVPAMASEMLAPPCEHLDDMSDWLSQLARDLSRNKTTATLALLQIKRAREVFAEVDLALADVEYIMTGLVDLERQSLAQSAPVDEELARRQQEVGDESDLPF
jgi:hypothetical protein